MNEYEKGQYVVAKAAGTASLVRGYGHASYRAGEELLITSTSRDFLNVRSAGGGSVFRLTRDRVRPVPRMIGEIPEGGIAPEDPRIAWIFEDAGRMADRLGLCRDYDRLCEAVGIPGRVRTFAISIMSGDGLEVTAKVEARSRRLAEMRVREQVMPSAQRPLILEASRADA